MIDKKDFLEHTRIFEDRIKKELNLGISELKSLITNDYELNNIYTCVLDKDDKNFDYFLFPIVKNNEEKVYIDKSLLEIQEIENKEYIGKFVSGEETCRFKYVFEKCKEYDEVILTLYNSFLVANYTWLGIDKRYINRMYKIKIIEYIDEFIDFVEYETVYNLDKDFKFNKEIFWNIDYRKIISKKSLTRLDEISYAYEIEKSADENILFDIDSSKVEDICSYKNKVILYSKYSNFNIFKVFRILKFDERLIKHFSKNFNKCNKIITLNHIKTFFENNSFIQVNKIFYSNSQINHISIVEYNPQILKRKIKYIYIEIKPIKYYDDLFYLLNTLRILVSHYEIRVYEK